MLLSLIAILMLGVVLALSIAGYRRDRDKDELVRLWRRDWPSAAEAASALASATGLHCERAPARFGWLRTFLLAPIWLFWGPMTSMTPEGRLMRWRLTGARPSGRALHIELCSGYAELSLKCEARASLWASATRDGASWSLEEQEGLRLMHPIGSARWQEGTTLLRAAFAVGLDRLRLENGALLAKVDLDERAPTPEEYPRVLDALESLTRWIEAPATA